MGTLSGNFSAGFIYHIMSGAEETPNVTSLAFGTPVVQPDRPFGSIISSCLRRLHVWCTLRWPFGCKKRSVVRIASTMYPTKAFIYLFIYIYIIFIFFIFQHCYNIDIHFVSWYVLSYILSYQSYFLSYLAIIPSYDQKISGYGDWDVQIIIYILCCALPLCKNGSSIWVSILHWPRSCQIISYEKWCWEVTFHGWSLNSELFIAFSSDHQFFSMQVPWWCTQAQTCHLICISCAKLWIAVPEFRINSTKQICLEYLISMQMCSGIHAQAHLLRPAGVPLRKQFFAK